MLPTISSLFYKIFFETADIKTSILATV